MRRARLPALPTEAYFRLAPDWICEVLSPSTARVDLVKKLPAYARAEVAHAWIVNPSFRTLECLRLDQGRWILSATFGGDDVVRHEPFEDLALGLGSLWEGG